MTADVIVQWTWLGERVMILVKRLLAGWKEKESERITLDSWMECSAWIALGANRLFAIGFR